MSLSVSAVLLVEKELGDPAEQPFGPLVRDEVRHARLGRFVCIKGQSLFEQALELLLILSRDGDRFGITHQRRNACALRELLRTIEMLARLCERSTDGGTPSLVGDEEVVD